MPGTILSPVLVGREREMEILDRALGVTQRGAGRCILLAGEAGIGKSRLADELSQRAYAARFLILQGHCSEQDRSYPYAPWIDALRAFLSPKSVTEIEELLGTFASEVVRLLPELSLLLPMIHPTPSLDPVAEKHRLFESLARLAVSLAAVQPMLIVLEDLHWSDEQSLDILHFFARRITTVPILVLGTYRSEDASPFFADYLLRLTRERLVEKIQLNPLTRPEVNQLMRTIFKIDRPIPPSWPDLFMTLTEGNPFFVEELLKSLIEDGKPIEKWDQLHIPISIQQIVQRRVVELPERTRHILSLASVIGERFDFELLQEIAGEDEPILLRMLKEMIAAQLIVEVSADQFAFRHALTRQVVYATLMLRERRAMHLTIGETIERLSGTSGEAFSAPLAYHFYQAEAWQKAMEYSQRAGEEAQALYALREALTHFTHALDAARQIGISMPLAALRGQAKAYEMLGEFEHARADYETVLGLAQRDASRIDEWRALIDLGFLWQSRDLGRAGNYYQQALRLARNLGDDSILAPTLNRMGNWYFNCGQAREELPFHQKALDLFQRMDNRHGMAQTMDLLGLASYQLGEVIEGAAYFEQAVPILRELGDRQGLVNVLVNLTAQTRFYTEILGEINVSQLVNLSEEAAQIAAGFSWDQGEARALIGGANALGQAGDYTRALAYLGHAQLLAEKIGHRESLANLHIVFGDIFIGLLALTEARQHLETALAFAQEHGSGIFTLDASARLATAAILQKDLARAKEVLAAALPSEYPQDEVLTPQRRCWSSRAQLELELHHPGKSLEIVDHLLAARPSLARYGAQAIPSLSHLRGQVLAALRRLDEAEVELRGALPIARRHGLIPLLWRLHADLGKVYRATGRLDDSEQQFALARTIIHDLNNNIPEGALRDQFLQHALATLPATPALTPRQSAKKESGGLTVREREIAVLISNGKSNREIADELVISETTAERHVANILSKLGFNSRTQIAVWAVEKGLGK